MSPRWLHWPASAAPNWRVDALCGTKSGTNNDTLMALTSIVESGETANFTPYAFSPVRRSLYTYIEFMVTVESSGAFADAATFVSSTSNRTYSLSVDGVSYNFETVTEVTSGALLRVEMRHSTSTVVQTFWDDLDSGDALVFTVTYA